MAARNQKEFGGIDLGAVAHWRGQSGRADQTQLIFRLTSFLCDLDG